MYQGFYKRTMLTIECAYGSTKPDTDTLSCLSSPLTLAQITITNCFDNSGEGLKSYRDSLDPIKMMALGYLSANNSAKSGDKLADYSLYQFAFQQFFQSSVRARQGNVLDQALSVILKTNGWTTYEKKQHTTQLKALNIIPTSKHDIDVFGSHNHKHIIIQIRSRDDTGGTTAKGSLVDLLRDIQRTGKIPNEPLSYIVYVWEGLNEQQRESLITRIEASLSLSPQQRQNLSSRNSIDYISNISLKVVYGSKELFSTLRDIFSVNIDETKYVAFLELLGSWDDLWLSHAMATLELEKLVVAGKTNFSILNELLKQLNIHIGSNHLKDYRNASIDIASRIAPHWKKESIPFSSPGDQLNYIRDLVLLRMAYSSLRGFLVD